MSNKWNTLPHDFLASIVVFLVALPLCLGIAVASGLPPITGLISGIIGGLVASSLAGCRLQVSGPAAGLVAVVAEIIQHHGVGSLGPIVLLAGILQMGFSFAQCGQWFRAISPALIQGMLGGIGVLIIAGQAHVMIDDKPTSSGIENLLKLPAAFVKSVFPMDGTVHHIAAMIGVMTILTILVWNIIPNKHLKAIPAPLVAVVLAGVMSYLLQLPINHVSIPDNIFASLNLNTFKNLPMLLDHGIFISALTIAIVASTESLLTATAVDNMVSSKNGKTDYNKELFAQGAANMASGVVGGLPITGVIVRSAANVHAGAKTRLSGILHGVLIAVCLLLFPHILERIPVSCLAGILVYTGFKLVHPENMKKLLAEGGKSEVVIYLVTVGAIVMTNLLEGIILGFVLASIKLLYNLSYLRINLSQDKDHSQLSIEGVAIFINLPRLANIIEAIPHGKRVVIDFKHTYYIDHACQDLLLKWREQYVCAGGEVLFTELATGKALPNRFKMICEKLEQNVPQASIG